MIRIILIACFVIGAPALVWAQDEEIIADPENQGTEEFIGDPENQGTDEEIIGDPDNEGDEVIGDPENQTATPARAPSFGGDSGFSSTSFVGSYKNQIWVDTQFDGDNEDVFEQFTDLDLRLEFEPDSQLKIVLEGEFRHWWAFKEGGESVRASYDARLGEAYVLWRLDRWSFTLGNQIVTWGATDLARPGDVVNARDLTIITPTGNLEKVPELMLDVSYAGDAWGIQLLLVPFFEANRVWAFGRDTAILNADTNPLVAERYPIVPLISSVVDDSLQDDIQPLVQATKVPDELPQNLSFGGRITATLANTDFGLAYFFGWDRTSFFSIDEDLVELLQVAQADGQFLEDFDFIGFATRNPEVIGITDSIGQKVSAGDELFVSEYRRIQTISTDVARYVGPIGVRADVAFQPAKTYLDADLNSVRRPTLSSALGLSYENFVDETDAYAITIEGFYNKPFSRDSALTETFVDASERGANDEMFIVGEQSYGAQAAVTWAIPGPELQITFGSVAYLSSSDLLFGGSISRRWFTWLRTGVAGLFFESYGQNDRLTLGTLYDQNDYVGIEVDGFF